MKDESRRRQSGAGFVEFGQRRHRCFVPEKQIGRMPQGVPDGLLKKRFREPEIAHPTPIDLEAVGRSMNTNGHPTGEVFHLTLNPLFQPGAAALPQCGAHFLVGEPTIPLHPQAHRQRDETIQVGSLSKLLVQAAVRQDDLAEAFQILRRDGQGSTFSDRVRSSVQGGE
jgi:hypothetical protein